MKIFKIFIPIFSYFFVFFLIIFIVCEVFFRFFPAYLPAPIPGLEFELEIASRGKQKYSMLYHRIVEVYLESEENNPLVPPYKVFMNKEIYIEGYLKDVLKTTRLPKNAVLEGYDFLRDKNLKEKTSYVVTTNNFGFRDPVRMKEKPKNTLRIILLGAYKAFGFGVEDHETYARKLEETLNQRELSGITFEVWNAGRQSTLGIFGWALLKSELLKYHPDLIIWDYGFVDIGLQLNDSDTRSVLRVVQFLKKEPLKTLFNKSAFFKRLVSSILFMRYLEISEQKFYDVTKAMLEVTKNQKIPVLILRQVGTEVSEEVFKHLVESYPHARYFNVIDAFDALPPDKYVHEAFYSESNWLTEDFSDKNMKEIVKYPEYQTNRFHYNKWGHQVLGRTLAKNIFKIFVEEEYLEAEHVDRW